MKHDRASGEKGREESVKMAGKDMCTGENSGKTSLQIRLQFPFPLDSTSTFHLSYLSSTLDCWCWCRSSPNWLTEPAFPGYWYQAHCFSLAAFALNLQRGLIPKKLPLQLRVILPLRKLDNLLLPPTLTTILPLSQHHLSLSNITITISGYTSVNTIKTTTCVSHPIALQVDSVLDCFHHPRNRSWVWVESPIIRSSY